jgi:hypothetical protein
LRRASTAGALSRIKLGLTHLDRWPVALRLAASDNEQMTLVERDSQLAALRQYADEARQAQGRLG